MWICGFNLMVSSFKGYLKNYVENFLIRLKLIV